MTVATRFTYPHVSSREAIKLAVRDGAKRGDVVRALNAPRQDWAVMTVTEVVAGRAVFYKNHAGDVAVAYVEH